jgi:hypothetical protein
MVEIGRYISRKPSAPLQLGCLPGQHLPLESRARELHHLGPLLCFLCEEPAEVAGEPTSPIPPKAASRALIFASARAALISLLSASTILARVFFGVLIPGLHLQHGDVSSPKYF